MSEKTRKIVLIVLAIAATYAGVRVVKSFAPEKKDSVKKNLYKSVRVIKVLPESHQAEIEFSGRISAYRKVNLYSEVGGVLLNDDFRTGIKVNKGGSIYSLDAREFTNTLKAAKSQLIASISASLADVQIDYPLSYPQWLQFSNKLAIDKTLPALPKESNKSLKRFLAGKGIFNTYYSIKAQEEKLSKFVRLADFDGMITESLVQKGTLVRAGQKLGVFVDPSEYELETEVSLSDLNYVKNGYAIHLQNDELDKSWKGQVVRINSVIDPNTQMVKVYVKLKGKGLKDGMYLHGLAKGNTFENAVKINRKLIQDGGLYTVKEDKILYKKVQVLYTNASEAIITGLSKGESIVADNMKGLYNGLQVKIIQ